MSIIAREVTNTLVDDVLSEATVDFWHSAKEKFHAAIDRVTFGRGNGQRLERWARSAANYPIPVPHKIVKKASEGNIGKIGRVLFNAGLWSVNNAAMRFAITVGLIAATCAALGFAPPVAVWATAATYGIKIGPGYGFMAAKSLYRRWRKTPGEPTKSGNQRPWYHASRLKHDVMHLAFGVGNRNGYWNLLEIVMTVTSAVLLLPTAAHFNEWVAGILAARSKPPMLVNSESASAAIMSNAAKTAELGMERQLAMQAASRAAAFEGRAVGGGILRSVGGLVDGIPERALNIAEQGTIKFLGGNIAKRYGETFSGDGAMRMAASVTLVASTAIAVATMAPNKKIDDRAAMAKIHATHIQQRML